MSSRLPAVAPWLLAALVATFTAWLCWPGLMSFDSLYQYRQAIGVEPMSSYHPPLMSWTWWALDAVMGPGGLLVFHLAVYWLAVVLLAGQLAQGGLRQCMFIVAMGGLPPLWVHSATLWNDSGVCAFLLLAVACGLQSRSGKVTGWLWMAALSLVWAMALKRSALFAVLPLAVWWGMTWWQSRTGVKPHRLRVAGIAVLVALLLSWTVGSIHRLAGPPVMKWGTIAVWDLVAVSLAEQQLVVPRGVLVYPDDNESEALARLALHFEPRVNGTLHKVAALIPNESSAPALWSAWVNLPMRHPEAYFSHRARVFGGLLGMGTVPQNLPYQRRMPSNDLGISLARGEHPIQDHVFKALRQLSRSPVWQPWVYLVLGGLGLALLWPQAHAARWVFASGVFSVAPLFVLAPATDFRYCLWLVASGWLLFLWSLFARWGKRRHT